MLWFFIPLGIAVVLAALCAKAESKSKGKAFATVFVLGVIVSGVIRVVGMFFHTGLMPDYSEGERIGYFTKFSEKGVIWKTWEGEMQVGTGQMAALQAPHPLSVDDVAVVADIQAHLGKKCKIRYREWLIMPFHVGDSKYEVVSVEWLDEKPKGE